MSRDQAVLNESSSYASWETHKETDVEQIQICERTHKLLSCLGFSPFIFFLPPPLSYVVCLLLSYTINYIASDSNLSVKETVTTWTWVGVENDMIKEMSMFKRVCVCVFGNLCLQGDQADSVWAPALMGAVVSCCWMSVCLRGQWCS